MEIPRPGDAPAAPSATLLAFPGLGQAIRSIYDSVAFWINYGVDLADYFLGWIPFGYLIGDQVVIFWDALIEPIARSITYNISFWIDGSISFGQGLNNVILDSANRIGFLNAEIRYGWGWLPPLPFPPPQIPYLPWFGLLQAQAADARPRGSRRRKSEARMPAHCVAYSTAFSTPSMPAETSKGSRAAPR